MSKNQQRHDTIRYDGSSYGDMMQQRIAELQATGNNQSATVDLGAQVQEQLSPIMQRYADRGNERKSTGRLATPEELQAIIERHEKRVGG